MIIPAPDWFFTVIQFLLLAGLSASGLGSAAPIPQSVWIQKSGLALLGLAVLAQKVYDGIGTRVNESWYQGGISFLSLGHEIWVSLGCELVARGWRLRWRRLVLALRHRVLCP